MWTYALVALSRWIAYSVSASLGSPRRIVSASTPGLSLRVPCGGPEPDRSGVRRGPAGATRRRAGARRQRASRRLRRGALQIARGARRRGGGPERPESPLLRTGAAAPPRRSV